jgi:hypothetical protein
VSICRQRSGATSPQASDGEDGSSEADGADTSEVGVADGADTSEVGDTDGSANGVGWAVDVERLVVGLAVAMPTGDAAT